MGDCILNFWGYFALFLAMIALKQRNMEVSWVKMPWLAPFIAIQSVAEIIHFFSLGVVVVNFCVFGMQPNERFSQFFIVDKFVFLLRTEKQE